MLTVSNGNISRTPDRIGIRRGRVALTRRALLILSVVAHSNAQTCTPVRVEATGIAGLNGPVRVLTMWDPDGPGPLPARLIVGGSFTAAGTVQAPCIAAWDGSAWTSLGPGLTATAGRGVNCLSIASNGDLLAGGSFFAAGGLPTLCIARWNGTTWAQLGSGISGSSTAAVYTLSTLPNGDIVAAGSFSNAGGVPVNNIARWNGASWSAMGPGLGSEGSGIVSALAVLSNGTLVGAGTFITSGPTSVRHIARWDGAAWIALTTGLSGQLSTPNALLALSNGDLIVAGSFSAISGIAASNVARWNGQSWTPIGAGTPGGGSSNVAASLALSTSGELLIGGSVVSGSDWTGYLAHFDGTNWSNLGANLLGPPHTSSTLHSVNTITVLPSQVMVGGSFTRTATGPGAYVACWDGSQWTQVGPGFGIAVPSNYSTLYTSTLLADNSLIVGGYFSGVNGIPLDNVGRLQNNTWSPLAAGLNAPVRASTLSSSGEVLAGGAFTASGVTALNAIARWNGTSWTPCGTGVQSPSGQATVNTISTIANGAFFAGGSFSSAGGQPANNIARWDGQAWSALGNGLSAPAYCTLVLPNGDLIAGGAFVLAGSSTVNGVARWNGTTWSALGAGFLGAVDNPVYCLALLSSGDLIAGGAFTTSGGVTVNKVARWDGALWQPLGAQFGLGHVFSLSARAEGSLIAGGSFNSVNGSSANGLALWQNGSWSPLDLGVTCVVRSLTPGPSAQLFAAGSVFRPSSPEPIIENALLATLACPPCYPNCDSSTSPPLLNANDFQCFLNKFAAADPYANCDHSTNPPTLNANDFQCFLNAFATGCP